MGSEVFHGAFKIHMKMTHFHSLSHRGSRGGENSRMIAWDDMIHHVVQPAHCALDAIKVFREEVKVFAEFF